MLIRYVLNFYLATFMTHPAELRVSRRYLAEHPWVIQGITGFLSAYFMEHPGFQVTKHFEEPETGMHVWKCDIPPNMKIPRLLRRLQQDIPLSDAKEISTDPRDIPQYLIDLPQSESRDFQS